ncbi:hypothetical protein B0J14DRAFT_212526 [Halenospora varia]|nr:hypothetical protein B0J14DRAFT_212526 [Halenospora varia]
MDRNFDAEAFSLLGTALVLIGFRFGVRLKCLGYRRLAVDDFLMVLAGCLYAAETVAAYYVGVYKGLTIAPMTGEEREALSHFPNSEEYRFRVNGSKTQLMGWIVYTCLLWILKTCMLFFYTRLTANVDKMGLRIKIGVYALPITFLATVCVELFGCHHVERHWQIYPDPGAVCYPAHSFPSLYTLIILNVMTDIYLMLIPLPMIWKSGLTVKMKIALFAMFTGGIFTTTAGFLRCILIITSGAEGAIQAGQWSCRESFIAVFVSNIPVIYPFLARFYRSTLSSIKGTGSGKSRSISNTISGGLRTFRKRKPGPYSIPGVSAWEDTVWDRTLNGEQGWSSGDRIYEPNNKTNIESSANPNVYSDTDLRFGSQDIAVRTEIGVSLTDLKKMNEAAIREHSRQ